jgi:hypothetical protein
VIESLVPGSPAAICGQVHPGDLVYSVDGKRVRDLSLRKLGERKCVCVCICALGECLCVWLCVCVVVCLCVDKFTPEILFIRLMESVCDACHYASYVNHMYVCVCVCVYIYISICMYVGAYVGAYVLVCVCTCT